MTLVIDVYPQAETVLRTTHPSEVPCLWCRRIVPLCDGERTLREVARLLHLPLPVVQKLADKATRKGWLIPLAAEEPELVTDGAWPDID